MFKKYFIKFIAALFGLLIEQSCIEPYIPESQKDFVPKIIVDGLITNESEYQNIKLSYTSKIDSLLFIPLSGCFVEVLDDLGNSYFFEETYPGNYNGKVTKENFVSGREFQLHFILSNGEEYESDMEKLTNSPPIDSIHYSLETKPTTDPAISYQGMQFYYNFKASNEDNRYYRLVVEETWEYHATYPISIFYSGGYQTISPDSSLFFCYNTQRINDIFLISTDGFEKNEYENFQLHFVDNQTQRLKYKYSILLKQYSISQNASNFWANLKKNSQESGGLYETQPALVIGNIHHVNYPDQMVLGYFGVSSVQEKRIFFVKPDDFTFAQDFYCIASKPNTEDGWPGQTDPTEWPIYFLYVFDMETESTILGIAPVECFDCTKSGGTTTKPEFW